MLGAVDFCEMKTLIAYNLNIRERANAKADMGNAVHKALELLALRKFAQQNGQTTIENEILKEPYHINKLDYDVAFWLGWEHQKKLAPTFTEWTDEKVIKQFKTMYYKLLEFKKGAYNPLNLDIVQPEQFFEFEVKEPWAQYEYNIAGKELKGYLKLRGTVDLIIRNPEGHYSSLDYKTGKRVNWAKGEWYKPKTKEYSDLEKDKQLLLYYYSLVKILGTYDISSIIYYLQDGGPFEFCFHEETYKIAEDMIKKEFKRINDIQVPKLTKNMGNAAENFYNKRKCSWCDFDKIQPKISTKKTVCEHFRTEVIQLGMSKVLDKYVKLESLDFYAGGGRAEQNVKK